VVFKAERTKQTMKQQISLGFIHDIFDKLDAEGSNCGAVRFDGTCSKCSTETSLDVELVPGEDGQGAFGISGAWLLVDGGMLCDECNATIGQTEVYTRVVGYLRPKSQMNIGKSLEVNDRKMFDLSKV